MMNRLQALFDRLVGVSQYENLLRPEDCLVLKREVQFAALEKPACWRRQPRTLNVLDVVESREGLH